MYECLKLTLFPRRSQPAKFSCNKSCGGVFGEEYERTHWVFSSFCFFFFFIFVFAGSDLTDPSHRAVASSGPGLEDGNEARKTSPEEVCEDAP